MNDIWSSGILTFDSPLKDLLDTNNYTLEDLLDEDELLQEVKGCHPQLKSFFNEEKNVAGLIKCLLRPPPTLPTAASESSGGGDGNGEVSDNDTLSGNGENGNNNNDNDSDNINSEPSSGDEYDNQSEDNTTEKSPGLKESNTFNSKSESTTSTITLSTTSPPSESEGCDAPMQVKGTSLEQGQGQEQSGNDDSNAGVTGSDPPNGIDSNVEEEEEVALTTAAITNDDDLLANGTLSSTTVNLDAAGTASAVVSTGMTNHDVDSNSPTSQHASPMEDAISAIEKETRASTSIMPHDEESKNIDGNDSCESNDNNNNNNNQPQPLGQEEKPIMGEWLLDNISEKIETTISKGSTDDGKNQTSVMSLSSCTKMTKEEYEKIYTRYPYMACEVICCEIDDILDIIVYGTVEVDDDDDDDIVDDIGRISSSKALTKKKKRRRRKQSILDMLFSLLYTTPPSELDDRRAGYLEKILSVLFRTRPKAMETYLNGDHLIYLPHCKQSSSSVLEYMNSNNKSTSSLGTNGDIIDTKNDMKMQDGDHNAVTTIEGEEDREDMTIHRGGGLSLLDALFNHLHSNSISQIVQRLLMPKPPSSKSDGDNGKNDPESLSNGEGNNDDDEFDDENLITSGVEDFGNVDCNWSDGEYALNLLLGRLLGETDDLDDLLDGDDSIRDTTNVQEPVSNAEKNEDAITRFDCSHHASEILIAIIQHSTLSSNVMKILTRPDVLSKLIECSCSSPASQNNILRKGQDSNGSDAIDEASVPTVFSRHESTMTTAMSVLETLVLQLGGYGTVPTSLTPSDNNQETNQNNISTQNNVNNNIMSDEVDHDDRDSQFGDIRPSTAVFELSESSEANVSSLIEQLPILLVRLSKLLRHPDTENWKSCMQYSNQPQQLLGVSRLRIVRLIESLVLLGRTEVDHILCRSNCLEICLDLFWKFPWCSMLHQSVANLLVHVLEGGEDRKELQHYFLYECNLMKRLMQSFNFVQQNSESEKITDENIITSNSNNGNDIDYGILLGMKNCQELDSSSGSSSLDAERGSINSEEGNDVPGNTDETDSIPVSDDDVDAAMEQEEQMERLSQGENDEASNEYNSPITALKDELELKNQGTNDEMTATPTSKNSTVEAENSNDESIFRIGYMGHVIIICQALVHACGANEETSKNVDETHASTSEAEASKIEDSKLVSSPGKEGPSNSSNVTSPNKLTGRHENQTSKNLNGNIATITGENSIMSLLRRHLSYSQWLAFVTSTLAAETAVQSTPLGGCNNQNESNTNEKVEEQTWSSSELVDHDMSDTSKGAYTGDGVIDLDSTKFDDTEVDIAVSLFDNLSLPAPSTNGVEEGSSQGNGRHRRKGVLGGEGGGNGSGSEFGIVFQGHQQSEYYQYKFDDPLGQLQDQFPEDMGFESNDFGNSESDDNEIEGDVPVMDLYTGNFNFDDVNDQNVDTGWANFDEGFGECAVNGDTEIIDSSPDPFGPSTSPLVADDFFGQDHSSQFTASFPDEEPVNKHSITSHSHDNPNIANQ